MKIINKITLRGRSISKNDNAVNKYLVTTSIALRIVVIRIRTLRVCSGCYFALLLLRIFPYVKELFPST